MLAETARLIAAQPPSAALDLASDLVRVPLRPGRPRLSSLARVDDYNRRIEVAAVDDGGRLLGRGSVVRWYLHDLVINQPR